MKKLAPHVAVAILTLVLLAAAPPAAAQAVPSMINYQGRLTSKTPDQSPVSGTVPMAFAIYDTIAGGTPLWSETWPGVVVTNGVFSLLLGGNGVPLPASVFAGGAIRYLDITVGGETLTPRQQIGAVGYAGKAADSDALGGTASTAWQRALSQALCPAGQYLAGFTQEGTPTCATPASTSYSAGTGLTLTGTTFSVLYGTAAGTAVQGNQTATVSAGSGLTGGVSGDAMGDGFSATLNVGAGNGIAVGADAVALGPLTADWSQTGAFDVLLGNAAADLRIMESAGDTYYGTLDVGDLGADQTYTFTTGGTVWTSGNDGGGSALDADLLDGQHASDFMTAGGSVAWSQLTGVPAGFADGVDNDTTYAAGGGLSLIGNTFSVLYGAAAGTAVQGNQAATIAAGSGLTGGVSGDAMGDGFSASLALGPLTADWSQTGAFDLVMGNAASELRIMESVGDTYYGMLDVGDLDADQTYTFTTGGTVWTSGNDGAGSTLDADTLDGSHASDFMTAGGVVAWSQLTGVPAGFADGVDNDTQYTAGAGLALTGTDFSVGAGSGITVNADDVALGPLTADWSQTGAFDVVLGDDASELRIMESVGDTYYGALDVGDLGADQTYTFTTGGTVWTSGNDGAGSTLDADLLDGQHASDFASGTHDHDSVYVNEGQADSITSPMVVNGTLALADIGQNGCTGGQVIQWDGAAWLCATASGATDHGALTGLADDDHAQYFNLSQDETVTGVPAFNGGTTGSTAPFSVDSTYAVADLNADLLDGQHANQLPYWSLTGNAGTAPGTNYLGTADSQPLVFGTDNTERMRLDTTGRLGIGTAPATSAPLTILGAGAGSEWLQLMDSAGNNQWHFNYLDGGLNFAETGVSDFRLYLEDGGNVGIGIGAPTARLNVQSSTGSTTGRFTNLNTGASTYGITVSTAGNTGGTRTGYFSAEGLTGNNSALYAMNASDTNNNSVGYFGYRYVTCNPAPDPYYTGMLTTLWADLPCGNTHGSSTAAFFRNRAISGAGYAGWFVGNVLIQGTLSKTAGSFLIDHPLDPAGKTLSHSFVESPDMMNVYNGNAVLDGKGEAWVQMPEWFEALNKDFRYQLTCIGGFAPVYIAEEIAGNRFRIGGGTPGLKVSWQVTGIRHDVYAEKYRIQVEQDKGEDLKGRYICPECYGLPRAYVPGEENLTPDPDANPIR